jgi:hypothetical protein
MEEKAIPFAPTTGVPAMVTIAQYREKAGEQTVTMDIPKRVCVTLQNCQRVIFEPGIHEVPVSLADHFYLAGSGAKKFDFKSAADKAAQEAKALRDRADELEKKSVLSAAKQEQLDAQSKPKAPPDQKPATDSKKVNGAKK